MLYILLKQQGVKTVAKNTAKEAGKQALAHPGQALTNTLALKNSASQTKDVIGTLGNLKDGGAGALSKQLAGQQAIDVSSVPTGKDLLGDINFNNI